MADAGLQLVRVRFAIVPGEIAHAVHHAEQVFRHNIEIEWQIDPVGDEKLPDQRQHGGVLGLQLGIGGQPVFFNIDQPGQRWPVHAPSMPVARL